MSLANLSLYGNQMSSIVDVSLYAAVNAKMSYLGGVIGCLAVAVGVVYLGGISAIKLLLKQNEKQQETINKLQVFLDKQQEQLILLEKELAVQKMNNQIWYNTQNHLDKDRDALLQTHSKLFVQYSNENRAFFDAINRQTTIADNHTETLLNVVNRIHLQHTAINEIQQKYEDQKTKLDTHKELMKEFCDNLDIITDQIEQSNNEIDHLSEHLDQSICEMEIKIEDAIEHFQQTKCDLEDRLEEQENELKSVEEEMFDRVETSVDKLTEKINGMGDRIDEVDREVAAMEKKVEDFVGVVERVDELWESSKNDRVILGWKGNVSSVQCWSFCKNERHSSLFESISSCDHIYLEQLLQLKNLERFDLSVLINKQLSMNGVFVVTIPMLQHYNPGSPPDFNRKLLENKDIQTIVLHFQKCGTKMFWNHKPITFEE